MLFQYKFLSIVALQENLISIIKKPFVPLIYSPKIYFCSYPIYWGNVNSKSFNVNIPLIRKEVPMNLSHVFNIVTPWLSACSLSPLERQKHARQHLILVIH